MRAKWLALLNLPKSARLADIKAQYRLLAKAHHPDVNAEPHSAEQFRLITEAYHALTAAVTRRAPAEEATNTTRVPEGPAMQARWNVRRKWQASEYPAWFTPPGDGDRNGDGKG